MNLLCSCAPHIMALILHPFTQTPTIGHKGKTNFPEQKLCLRAHFPSATKMQHRNPFIRLKHTLLPHSTSAHARNEMWHTYTPLGIQLITQHTCRSAVNRPSEMVPSTKYSTNLNKREAARIEYPAIGATSFVSIVVYLTCTIML